MEVNDSNVIEAAERNGNSTVYLYYLWSSIMLPESNLNLWQM